MKRAFRLTRSAEIKRVRRNGKSVAHPFLLLLTLPNEQKGVRVAVTAGRNVGGAVQRNRAKRILRAAIQPFITAIKPDMDILLLARPAINPMKSTQVEEVLKGLLAKASLLN